MNPPTEEPEEQWRARVLFHVDTGMCFHDRRTTVEIAEGDGSFSTTLRHLTELEQRVCPRPDGLIIVIERGAKTIDGTVQMAWEEARDLAALAALTAGAALGEVTPLLIYDATPGKARRAFRQYCGIGRDLRVPTTLDHAQVASLLRGVITSAARHEIEDTAVHVTRSAARGGGLDAFATAWLGVERMNATIQRKFNLPGYRIDRVRCAEQHCPGAEVKKPESAGMKHLMESVGRKQDWRTVKAVRVQLQHGLDGTDTLSRKIGDGDAARLAREFACHAMTTALGLADGSLHAAPHALAGRFVIGGTYCSPDLPPAAGHDEPYLDATSVTTGIVADRSAEVRAAMKPTFAFAYEVDHVGVVGARAISSIKVR